MVLGLLLSGNAYAKSIWDYLEIGMTKKELSKLTNPFVIDANLYYFRTKEIIPLGGYESILGVFGTVDCDNIEYFPKNQTEILKHWEYQDQKTAPIYIFENVTKKVKCNSIYTKKGNGTLKAVAFNNYDALIIADPKNTKKYEAKKAGEEKIIAEEKKKERRRKKNSRKT